MVMNPFMSTSSPCCQVAGQITAYATLVLSAQYRMHTFLILIFKKYARLIQWDCGGTVITVPMYYDDETHLLNFFIHYDHANPKTHSHDSTISPPTKDEDQNAQMLSDLASAKLLLTITIADPTPPHH